VTRAGGSSPRYANPGTNLRNRRRKCLTNALDHLGGRHFCGAHLHPLDLDRVFRRSRRGSRRRVIGRSIVSSRSRYSFSSFEIIVLQLERIESEQNGTISGMEIADAGDWLQLSRRRSRRTLSCA